MAGYVFAAACVALLCACYAAGRAALSPRRTAAVAAGALCVPAAQFAIQPAGRATAPTVAWVVSAYLVFAVLPLVAGRYVAVQRRAVELERLRERGEIARQMHDSLGRRLSLAAVQAAALEVSDLPDSQHAAIARLAVAVRASVTELHEILHANRQSPRMSAAGDLIEEFRAAGARVSVRERGTPRPLRPDAGQAAYRVIEEGLTNAIRHAPGRPVSVGIAWKARTLQLTVVNQADDREYAPGSGLADLAERLRQAGGSLRHEVQGGQFRLRAAVPAVHRRQPHITPLGLTAGALLLVILPAVVLIGVR